MRFAFGFLMFVSGVGIMTGCSQHGNPRFFADQAYHYQTLRVMNDIAAGGGETGEVLEIIRQIREGDAVGWYKAWSAGGDRSIGNAERTNDSRSRGRALLRAHSYLRTAEFFLPPEDPRRLTAFERSEEVFYRGLDELRVPYQRFSVAYEGARLGAVYYPAARVASRLPLLVLVGGFDSTLEELYFVLAKSATERGYNVLTYEGPGQGAVLRKYKVGFTPEWEKPTSKLLDAFFAEHGRPRRTVLIGMSLGGYFAPRAAAFDRRIDGVVAYDVLYDFASVARRQIPGFVQSLERAGYDRFTEFLINVKAAFSPSVAWGLQMSKWAMKKDSGVALLREFSRYSLAGVAEKIGQDVLILAGTRDHFVPLAQAEEFRQSLKNARSVATHIYDEISGGSEHCQFGASEVWQADLFDWLRRFEPGR